jgi:peptidyl-prolyl cis-trans isomerase A (cyclophilin A)
MKLISILFAVGFYCLTFAGEQPVVVVETNRGHFEIELNPEKAPVSVKNFLEYVDSHFYDQTIVHRVVKNFVVQAGGLDEALNEKPGRDPIVNEANNGLSNVKASVAMARTNDINSATTHFFVNLKDNTRLDYQGPNQFGYAVFGKVISGFDVIEKMQQEPVQTVGEFDDVPVTAVIITSIHRK